jgi:cysteine sulfinate desulfinase/cysteine desulfurase-like protein
VAVGCASNAVGTINPVRDIADWAHRVGALVFLDAVHYAPHCLLDVQALGCDFLACSAYKFFGPHVGVLWGRRSLLEQLEAYKVRPAPLTSPDKWMTGTQNHEGIAGVLAAINYLAALGQKSNPASTNRYRPSLVLRFMISPIDQAMPVRAGRARTTGDARRPGRAGERLVRSAVRRRPPGCRAHYVAWQMRHECVSASVLVGHVAVNRGASISIVTVLGRPRHRW